MTVTATTGPVALRPDIKRPWVRATSSVSSASAARPKVSTNTLDGEFQAPMNQRVVERRRSRRGSKIVPYESHDASRR